MNPSDPDETLPPSKNDSDRISNEHTSSVDHFVDKARFHQAGYDTSALNIDPGQTLDHEHTANAGDATDDFSLDPDSTADFQTSPRYKALPKTFALQIPGYEILGELGRGAMGVVYSARQIRADRTVALKVMLNLDHANSRSIERFKVEAKAAARLVHPNIVQVYDVNEAAGCPYFTLEYVTGGTLANKIDEQMLTAKESAGLLSVLANAMQFAHDRGIVHRDLKPANIMLDSAGQPKIADFGLARRLEDTSHLTQDGTVIGTPSYMAPEQTLGDPTVIKPAVDIYALGAILFELLTGRPPFKGASVWEVLRQVRSTEPVRPSELQPGVPQDLENICLKCLQKEPDKRYPSAQSLQQDLQRYLNNEPVLARPIGRLERFVRICKRHPSEAILVGSLAMILTIVAIGASVAAYRIANDRDQIAAQNEKIEKQRDQIQQEKNLSDNRLTIYRDTISSLVNRAPRLLESSPIGSNTKRELTDLLNQVLSESVDTGVVGSSKQWGIMATHLRQGETSITEAQAIDISNSEGRQERLEEALSHFQSAFEIAKAVYDSDEADRCKASSNYSIVLAKVAHAIFAKDPEQWKEAVPLFNRSIELASEAIDHSMEQNKVATADSSVDDSSSNVAEYRMKKADRQYQYANFLFQVNPTNPKYQDRCIELIVDARATHREVLAQLNLPKTLYEDTRQNLGLASKLQAQIHQARSEHDNTVSAFEESISCFQTLAAEAPYRPSFRRNLAVVAEQYGQYLLLHQGDPARVRELYDTARRTLDSIVRTSDVKFLEQSGLAIQWYALGLIAEKQKDPAEATRCYMMATSIRERHYRESDDRVVSGNAESRAERMDNLVSWTLCLGRAGKQDAVIANIKKILSDISSFTIAAEHSKDLYATCAAALGILAQHFPTSSAEHASMTNKAIQLLQKSIECGFDNAKYLTDDPDFQWLARDSRQLETILELLNNKKELP